MSQPRISLCNTTDLLDVLPTFLGFYPTESLCALYLDNTPAGHRVAVTARTDLPTTPQALASATEHMIGFLGRYDLVVLVAYSADQQAARDVLTHLIYASDPTQVLTAVTATPEGWSQIDPATPQVASRPTRTRPAPAPPPSRRSSPGTWCAAPATTSPKPSPHPTRTPPKRSTPPTPASTATPGRARRTRPPGKQSPESSST